MKQHYLCDPYQALLGCAITSQSFPQIAPYTVVGQDEFPMMVPPYILRQELFSCVDNPKLDVSVFPSQSWVKYDELRKCSHISSQKPSGNLSFVAIEHGHRKS